MPSRTSPSVRTRPSGSTSEWTVQACRSTSHPRSRPMLKNSLSFWDWISITAPPWVAGPGWTVGGSPGSGSARDPVREGEGRRRLRRPALEHEVTRADDLVGPDDPDQAPGRRAERLDGLAEDVPDLAQLLTLVDSVPDAHRQPQQPAPPGLYHELAGAHELALPDHRRAWQHPEEAHHVGDAVEVGAHVAGVEPAGAAALAQDGGDAALGGLARDGAAGEGERRALPEQGEDPRRVEPGHGRAQLVELGLPGEAVGGV